MTRRHTLTVTLRRRSKNQPWGISISGGSDLGTPLIVTRSENEDLQKGDVIKKIDEYDVRDLRHVDAQNIFKNSDCVKVAIERTKSQVQPPVLPRSPVPPSPSPDEYNRSRYSGDQFVPSHDSHDDIREERYYLSQPYRTTPLVLPGAKIKKDAPMGECYLRHHPNPMMRASPQHYDIANPEVAMKQKVADTVLQRVLSPYDYPKVVSKQFNSPIGLYSDQNIQDTLRCQASAIPKKPGKFDPSQSETYKALQEEYDERHEVRQPTRAGVFSPLQARHAQQMRSKSPGYSPFVSQVYNIPIQYTN